VIEALKAADVALLRLIRTAGHSSAAEQAVRRFSALGEHGAIWVAIGMAGALIDRDRRGLWMSGARTAVAAYALNTAIKHVAGRHRPELEGLPPLVKTASKLSFPSAHATTSFAGARVYAGLMPSLPLYVLATGLALSRPYLGVHYPSDVIAGAALGDALGKVARWR
jgi:undecaprenyl-diphosphatase